MTWKSIIGYIALFLGAITIIVYIYYKIQFKFWKKKGFQFIGPFFPLGNFHEFILGKLMPLIIYEMYQKTSHHRYVGIWFLFKPILLVHDLELIKNILTRDFNNFMDRGCYVNEENDPLSAHLGAVAGSKWKRMRVNIMSVFTSSKMKMIFPILTKCNKNLQDAVHEAIYFREGVIDVKEYASRYTADVVFLSAFGIDGNCLQNPDFELYRHGLEVMNPTHFELMRSVFQMALPKISRFFRTKMFRTSATNYFLLKFTESVKYREENNLRFNDFLDSLIQLKNETNGTEKNLKETPKMTLHEIAAQAFVFFLGGFESSSSTIQFAIYELARNPTVQERLRSEILHALAENNGELTYDSLMEMTYLGRVIDETLRIYPSISVIQRECYQDYQIPGTKLIIPKGVQVGISVLGLHNDPNFFPDPQKFDPDRFLTHEKSTRHRYSYIPFGDGPRSCVGMRFGLLKVKMAIVSLLTKFEFSLDKTTPIPVKFKPNMLTLSPERGMPLHVRILNFESNH